ncbi:hypothetical protein [Necropsobacter massiliensis]|uniref:hypothetical protein n=1 Tax=Necropsobacter massiliensis TaxID=1400001 RepID=UPI0005960815|nr:hypothetical protein [Necropsobacter massiliensis]
MQKPVAINLLPWRQYRHRQKLNVFLWKTLCCLLCSALICAYLLYLIQQQRHIASDYHRQLHQLSQQLTQRIEQTNKLRRHYAGKEQQTSVPSSVALRFLALLAQLPLEQGELSEVVLSAAQPKLKGQVEYQQEFERIQHFLSTHPGLQEVKLTAFTPQQTALRFEFSLTLKEAQ